jgi:hypothetical protein
VPFAPACAAPGAPFAPPPLLRERLSHRLRCCESAAACPKRNGGRHCCQPPLRRAKDMPVFVTWLIEAFALPTRSRSWLTSSGVASHQTAPSCEEPCRFTRLRLPKVRLSFDPLGLALLKPSIRRPNISRGQNRPMFCGPSWGNRSRVPLRSPKFRRTPGAASRERQLPLPAPLPGWPRFHFRRSFDNACRRRSDLWSPAASSIRCRLSDEAGTAVPITRLLCTPLPSRGSKIFGNEPVDNGDIGCNRRNFWGFQHAVADSARGPRPRLPFRSPPTTSLMCLNRL